MAKKSWGSFKNRFSNPSTRGIMSGVLLSPGPVSTKVTVQGISRVFNNAVNKAKFQVAASKLQEAGFGELKETPSSNQRSATVFIKKPPEYVMGLLQVKENSDLCTIEEYAMRFSSPPPSTLSMSLRQSLVQFGFVPAQYFAEPTG